MLAEAMDVSVEWALEHPAEAQLMFWRPIAGWQPSAAAFAPAESALAHAASSLEEAQRLGLLDRGPDREELVQVWAALVAGVIAQQLSNEPGIPADAGWTSRHGGALVLMFVLTTREGALHDHRRCRPRRQPSADILETRPATSLAAEYDALLAMVDGFAPGDWDLSTDCTEWRVRDMVAHIAGAAEEACRLPVMVQHQVGALNGVRRGAGAMVDLLAPPRSLDLGGPVRSLDLADDLRRMGLWCARRETSPAGTPASGSAAVLHPGCARVPRSPTCST